VSDVPLIKQFLQQQGQFMAYLMAITRDLNAAEEIFQNAAVVVMEKSIPASESLERIRDFHAWAKEIVRRQALSYLQKQVRAERREKPVQPVLLDQITRAFMENDAAQNRIDLEAAALRGCVGELASSERLLLQLRYTQRASFAAIGMTVGKTEGAVQRAVSRIRKRLHDCVLGKIRLSETAS
jgi:RNA polymerase sigma-70 factor (ECF subfamily)